MSVSTKDFFPTSILVCTDTSITSQDARFEYQCTASTQVRTALTTIHLIIVAGVCCLTLITLFIYNRISGRRFYLQLRALPGRRLPFGLGDTSREMYKKVVETLVLACSDETVIRPPVISHEKYVHTTPRDEILALANQLRLAVRRVVPGVAFVRDHFPLRSLADTLALEYGVPEEPLWDAIVTVERLEHLSFVPATTALHQPVHSFSEFSPDEVAVFEQSVRGIVEALRYATSDGAAPAAAAAAAAAAGPFNPPEALQMAYYSASAYCDGSQIGNGNSWDCVPCALAGNVVNSTFMSNNDIDVYGFVAKQDDGTIIVGFRGTDAVDLKDWILDLDFNPTKGPYGGCTGCEVHTGFYDGYLALSQQMFDAVNAYGGVNAPAIYVTGHSLGGAMSELATYELILAGYAVTRHIHFGTPRVGNPAFAASYETVVRDHNLTSVKINTLAPQSKWSPVLAEAVRRAAGAADPAAMKATVIAAVQNSHDEVKALPAAQRSSTKAGRLAARAHVTKAIHAAVMSEHVDFSANLRTGAAAFNTTTWRVTHNADPVPHLPLEIMGFTHPAQEIWYNEPQTSYTTCDPSNGEDPTCSDSVPLDIDVLDHLSYMLLDIALMCGIAK